ncbi:MULTISPECIES: AAA family ATPase [unclassified Fibrobacter]|uniref:AAA family ATPase n=1 Tax=unclassified Fibrobacter TaxID=2634177 RepID=UPI0025C41AE8|nr:MULTISPECIES: AAA family ATPase [unclassified Fibrobacter]
MLEKMTVKGLLHQFNYELDFTNENGPAVKYITGPNGFGKTTILKLLVALYGADWKTMAALPFKSFDCVIDGKSLSITKDECQIVQNDDSDEQDDLDVRLDILFEGQKPLQISVKGRDGKFYTPKKSGDHSVEMILSQKKILYIPETRVIEKNLPKRNRKTPVKTCNDSFIKYLSILSDKIEDFLKSKLKNEFPVNGPIEGLKFPLIDKMLSFGLNPEFLTDVKKYGLVVERILEENGSVQHEIDKIEKFVELVNRYEFINKKISISEKDGFRFKLTDKYNTIVDLDDLSSGERQYLMLVYKMLFESSEHTLVLVDEPENSMHMSWILEFPKVIKELCKWSDLQFIVCTHNSNIFEQRWDMSQDLFEKSQPRKAE